MKKSVFPDTNIFLHYQPLDQIDLLDVFNCDEVELVIAPALLDELDHHKWDHPIRKLRDRAQEAARRLDSWISGQQDIRSGVSVSLHFARPKDATISSIHLNARSNDDLLFATILKYSTENPDQETVLLTGDTGSRLRAESLGVTVKALSDDYLLPPARDEAQKEFQRVQRELRELRNRLPSLSLLFTDGSDRIEVLLEPQPTSLSNSMRELLNRVKDDMSRELDRYMSKDSETNDVEDPDHARLDELSTKLKESPFIQAPSEEEVERYRREARRYPEKFETYLKHKGEIENEHRRTVRLDLIVENTGHRMAEDILFTLTLPDHLIWRKQPSDEELPELPKPPTPPRTPAQLFLEEMGYPPQFHDYDPQYAREINDHLFEPTISDSGCVMEWEVGECRQQRSVELEPLFAMFRTPDKITNFHVDYKIHEKSLPQPVEGRLLIIVRQRKSPSIGKEETVNH